MPFDKEKVRRAIPPLVIGEPVLGDEHLASYREYYGIDFENKKNNLTASVGYIDITDYRIFVHTFQQEHSKGTVFVMHGYYDHVGIYDHIIEYLLDQNFSVIMFDLPGHGLSTGDSAAIPDFHRYQIVLNSVLDKAKGNMPGPWHVVGQSTGCAIIMDFLLSGRFTPENAPFNKVILLAPLVRPHSWFLGKLAHFFVTFFTQHIARAFARNSNDEEFLHFLKEKDPLQSRMLSARWVGALKNWVPYIENRTRSDIPITIIQGQKDETVDWQHNVGVIKKLFRQSDFVFFARARHQMVNEEEALRHKIFEVIGARLSL